MTLIFDLLVTLNIKWYNFLFNHIVYDVMASYNALYSDNSPCYLHIIIYHNPYSASDSGSHLPCVLLLLLWGRKPSKKLHAATPAGGTHCPNYGGLMHSGLTAADHWRYTWHSHRVAQGRHAFSKGPLHTQAGGPSRRAFCPSIIYTHMCHL